MTVFSKLKDNKRFTIDKEHKFFEVFDLKSGFYARSGIIEDDKDTGKDPFMRSFPGLLDIGIMGGCTASDLCKVDCYQGARANNPNKNMKLEEYKQIIDEGEVKGLQQVALGGAGNPNDHQNFKEILEYTRSKNIIPNYTTAGIGLTKEMVQLTKENCGAVAVSWHYAQYSVNALNKFLDEGCKTSIHFVLSKKTISTAINLLKNHTLPYTDNKELFVTGINDSETDKTFDLEKSNINAIIFLLYKPVGCGKQENVLTLKENEAEIKEFFSLIVGSHPFKIGFDSCTIPAVLQFSNNVNPDSTDTCEGGRFSAYINADMKMVPCSFDQDLKWAVDLRSNKVEQAWKSELFNSFRKSLSDSCPSCESRNLCMGGCPIKNEIVLCNKSEREHKG